MLALISREVAYERPRLPFYDLVEEAVAAELSGALARRLSVPGE